MLGAQHYIDVHGLCYIFLYLVLVIFSPSRTRNKMFGIVHRYVSDILNFLQPDLEILNTLKPVTKHREGHGLLWWHMRCSIIAENLCEYAVDLGQLLSTHVGQNKYLANSVAETTSHPKRKQPPT